MKVAIFGASVSAQTVRHGTNEVTGYSEVLRRQWMAAIGATSLKQICYPGGRLSDGGLYRVGHVLGHMPDLCLFEPLAEDNARGRPVTRAEAEFVYRSFLRRRILPMVVLLPEPAKRTARAWASFDLHAALCRKIGLPTVEIDLFDEGDLSHSFTGLHTQLPGAELYAATIVRALQAIDDWRAVAERAFAVGESLSATLHEVLVPTTPLSEIGQLTIRLWPRARGAYGFRVIQPQQIGPFSPMLVIEANGAPSTGDAVRSIWDPFCHYERSSFSVLDDRRIDEPGGVCTVSIRLSALDPPYETARRVVERWPQQRERNLRPTGPIKVFSTIPVDVELLQYQ